MREFFLNHTNLKKLIVIPCALALFFVYGFRCAADVDAGAKNDSIHQNDVASSVEYEGENSNN